MPIAINPKIRLCFVDNRSFAMPVGRLINKPAIAYVPIKVQSLSLIILLQKRYKGRKNLLHQ